MILVEGSDRIGKTTLTMKLRRHLPQWSYRHHTKPPVAAFPYFMWFLADAHPRVVVDRLHWSEHAYGLTYRSQTELSPHQWRLIELALMSRATRVVLMTDNIDSIRERWGKDEMWPSDKLQELLDRFCNLYFQRSGDQTTYLPRQMYNLHDLLKDGVHPTPAFWDLVMDAKQDAKTASALLPPSVGLGCVQPEFMILAEAPGEVVPDGDLAPGLPLDRGRASDFFWAGMDEIGAHWWKGYYTNANAFDDYADLADYVNVVLRPKKIICLGGKASLLVSEAIRRHRLRPEVNVSMVEHPMYVARFQRSRSDQWLGKLQKYLDPHVGSITKGT